MSPPRNRRFAAISPQGAYQPLLEYYGPQHWWPAETPFEVMLGAILTQNTAWSNVERAIAALYQRDALRVDTLLAMPEAELAQLIRPAGYFNQKARRLKILAEFLVQRGVADAPQQLARQDSIHALRHDLLALHGIGPETADSILLYGLALPSFVIDAYTRRIFGRLGWIDGSAPYEALRQQFEAALPGDVALFNEYHALIVAHAKRHCKVRPDCHGCPLSKPPTNCPARLQ